MLQINWNYNHKKWIYLEASIKQISSDLSQNYDDNSSVNGTPKNVLKTKIRCSQKRKHYLPKMKFLFAENLSMGQ